MKDKDISTGQLRIQERPSPWVQWHPISTTALRRGTRFAGSGQSPMMRCAPWIPRSIILVHPSIFGRWIRAVRRLPHGTENTIILSTLSRGIDHRWLRKRLPDNGFRHKRIQINLMQVYAWKNAKPCTHMPPRHIDAIGEPWRTRTPDLRIRSSLLKSS